jgi:Fe-S-cluster containining protein
MTDVSSSIEDCRQFKKTHDQDLEIIYPRDTHWRCLRCHACCGDTKQHIRHIRLLETEATAISRFIGHQQQKFCASSDEFGSYKFEMLKQSSGDCIFLKGNSCTVYPERPLTCRFYPFYLEEPSEGRYKFGLTDENCPGLGQGPSLEIEFFARLLEMASKKMQNSRSS